MPHFTVSASSGRVRHVSFWWFVAVSLDRILWRLSYFLCDVLSHVIIDVYGVEFPVDDDDGLDRSQFSSSPRSIASTWRRLVASSTGRSRRVLLRHWLTKVIELALGLLVMLCCKTDTCLVVVTILHKSWPPQGPHEDSQRTNWSSTPDCSKYWSRCEDFGVKTTYSFHSGHATRSAFVWTYAYVPLSTKYTLDEKTTLVYLIPSEWILRETDFD